MVQRKKVLMEQIFAQAFTDAWAQPTPEGLVELLHPDVVLLQPHRPAIRGRVAALQEFRRLLAWLPGLHGEVTRTSGADGIVFIEWLMKLPVGDRMISIPAVDRFRLEHGLGVERVVYFDQMALVRVVALHPPLWRGYLKYRFGL